MMRYVYVLKSLRNPQKIYVGSSKNPQLRLKRHNWGECVFTAHEKPWEIVFVEGFFDEREAIVRERQLKGWTRAKKEALILGDLVRLKELGKRRGR